VLKLAHAQPELRPHLLPLLLRTASPDEGTPDAESLADFLAMHEAGKLTGKAPAQLAAKLMAGKTIEIPLPAEARWWVGGKIYLRLLRGNTYLMKTMMFGSDGKSLIVAIASRDRSGKWLWKETN